MNNKDKQKALLELGSKTLDSISKAHKDLEGIALGAVLCSIRVSYEMQARAIISHSGAPAIKHGTTLSISTEAPENFDAAGFEALEFTEASEVIRAKREATNIIKDSNT